MGILDDALRLQDGKRSQRLSQAARKAKIDSHKIKEGTYRGIDLTDGTARVQLDDQPTATSGYRLITNAPLGDGDRVSIRPNGVGLPRADARNVAPLVEDVAQNQTELVFANLYYLEFFFNTNPIPFNPSVDTNSNLEFTALTPISKALTKYSYIKNGRRIRFINKVSNFDESFNTITPILGDVFGASINTINPSLCSYAFGFADSINSLTLNTNSPLLPNDNVFAFFECQFSFESALFNSAFGNIPNGYYLDSSDPLCPIETEIKVNGIDMLFQDVQVSLLSGYYEIYFSGQLFETLPTGLTEYTASFRFRRRVTSGDPLPWFQL